MQVIIFHLSLSHLHQLTNSVLDTLVVLRTSCSLRHVCRNDHEELKDTLSAFQIEAHDMHPEHEWNQWGFSHTIQISCTNCKANAKTPMYMHTKVLTSYEEVLVVVRANLLGINEIVADLMGEKFIGFCLL